MPKIVGFERSEGSSCFFIKRDGDGPQDMTLWPLRDGMLEAYMELYQLSPDECFTMMALDVLDDTVAVPGYEEPGMRKVVESILAKADTLEWSDDLDRDEILSRIAVSADTAPELSAAWRAQRIRDEEAIAANQRRQEELLAAEFVDSMPSVLKSLPKSNAPMRVDDSVRLAIKYVP